MNELSIGPVSVDTQPVLIQSQHKNVNIKSPMTFQLLTDHINANRSNKTNLNFIIKKNNVVQTDCFPSLLSLQKENHLHIVDGEKAQGNDVELCNLKVDDESIIYSEPVKVADNNPLQFITIPLCTTGPNQLQVQSDTIDVTNCNNTNNQTIFILRPNDKPKKIEKVKKEEIKVSPETVSNVVCSKSQNVAPLSGIIYRVINPEDLNLYDPRKTNKKGVKRPNILTKIAPKKLKVEPIILPEPSTTPLMSSQAVQIVQTAQPPLQSILPKKSTTQKKIVPIQSKKPVQIQPKTPLPQTQPIKSEQTMQSIKLVIPSQVQPVQSAQIDSGLLQITSVTRCGRSIRPPRHIVANYDQVDVNGEVLKVEIAKNKNIEDIPAKHRHVCPSCKKAYANIKRIALHLIAHPDHATNLKSLEILKKYENAINEKKVTTAVAQCQTDIYETSQIVDNLKENKNLQKSINNNVSNNKLDREKEERSLFKIFMRILQKTAPEHRANMFIRQLAILTSKLRKLMPCLLQKSENNTLCSINDAVAKILDLSPGNYNINMDAISNVKTQSGSSKHKHSLSENTSYNSTYDNLWTSEKEKETVSKIENHVNNCTETNHVSEWPSTTQKPKWIPIGSDNSVRESLNVTNENWIQTDCNVLLDNSTFNPSNETIKTWDTNLHEHDMKNSTSSENSWITTTIGELTKINITQDITSQNHILSSSHNGILSPSVNPSANSDSLEFNCKDKMVNIHSDLVFGVEKDILPINSITTDSAVCVSNSNESDNFDFTDSHFDIQMDSNKLNFSESQFNDLKYDGDTLPPFRKIESKNLQLPSSLNDISSDTDKFHMSSDDSILNASNYPVASESLELSMDTTQINTLDSIVNSCDISKTIVSNEDTIHCDGETLLNNSELNLPINVPNTLSANESILSVSESSLDNRLNLSNSQSVLNLLDPLTSDCLSFSDSDLNPRTTFEFEFLKFGEHD